jgi:hypothetical protein
MVEMCAMKMCRFWLVSIVLFSLAGCGPRYPETAAVAGRVTYGGRPVPTGRICFWPKEGRPAMGEIAADGTYSLSSFTRGDGAIAAEHRVSIKASRVRLPEGFNESGRGNSQGAAGRPVVEWLVPQRYERPETSGLTATVRPGENHIDFDLPVER